MSSQHLLELAREDARLFHLRQQIHNLPRRSTDLDAELRRLERQKREAEDRHQQAEASRRRLEQELLEMRQRHAKSESRLATLTSTEQYQALVREMGTQREKIDALESAVLEAMERSEQVQRQRDAETARLDEAVRALRAQQEQLRADLAAAQAELPGQTQARDAAAARVDAAARSAYERILRAKGDAALALVTGQTCGICMAVQPPQVLQRLRQGAGMHMCQMCGRILVWDPGLA